MNAVYRLALAILMISVASLAVAADPQPQSPTNAPAAAERQAAPGLDINQAELEAGVTVDPLDPAKAAGDTTSPMMIEIQAAMDQSRAEIAELAVRAAAAPDHESGLAIQREITTLKRQTELDILAVQARYARADGNEELADQIDAAIAAIVSPPAPTAPAELRPAPSSQ